MACNNCNNCNDNGCLKIVYPECIVTKVAYPCIGVAAGVTGTALFTGIDGAICGLLSADIAFNVAITSIQASILTINSTLVTVQEDIVALEACVRCDEAWKTLGDAGDMENGEPIPAVAAAVSDQIVGRIRRHGVNHTEINFTGNVDL